MATQRRKWTRRNGRPTSSPRALTPLDRYEQVACPWHGARLGRWLGWHLVRLRVMDCARGKSTAAQSQKLGRCPWCLFLSPPLTLALMSRGHSESGRRYNTTVSVPETTSALHAWHQPKGGWAGPRNQLVNCESTPSPPALHGAIKHLDAETTG